MSGEQILMKGNWESSAILAASAVLPLCGGPEEEKHSHSQSYQIAALRCMFAGVNERTRAGKNDISSTFVWMCV